MRDNLLLLLALLVFWTGRLFLVVLIAALFWGFVEEVQFIFSK